MQHGDLLCQRIDHRVALLHAGGLQRQGRQHGGAGRTGSAVHLHSVHRKSMTYKLYFNRPPLQLAAVGSVSREGVNRYAASAASSARTVHILLGLFDFMLASPLFMWHSRTSRRLRRSRRSSTAGARCWPASASPSALRSACHCQRHHSWRRENLGFPDTGFQQGLIE